MSVLGIILAVAGIATALLVWRHDLQRLMIEATAPQAAPKRMPPEIHALAACFTGIGAWILWSFLVALGVFVFQITLAYFVLPRLFERIAYGPVGARDR